MDNRNIIVSISMGKPKSIQRVNDQEQKASIRVASVHISTLLSNWASSERTIKSKKQVSELRVYTFLHCCQIGPRRRESKSADDDKGIKIT